MFFKEKPHNPFTARDIDIFTMLVSGSSLNTIGNKYNISPERIKQIFYRLNKQFIYCCWRADFISVLADTGANPDRDRLQKNYSSVLDAIGKMSKMPMPYTWSLIHYGYTDESRRLMPVQTEILNCYCQGISIEEIECIHGVAEGNGEYWIRLGYSALAYKNPELMSGSYQLEDINRNMDLVISMVEHELREPILAQVAWFLQTCDLQPA